jgi:acyl carrier protein
MNDAKVKIKSFLSAFIQTAALKEDDDIFALGFIDSLFAMQLITWVEKEFGVQIRNEDLDIENFNTIEAIANLILRRSSCAMGA